MHTVVDNSPADRQELQVAADTARSVEVEARLAVRTAEERPMPFEGKLIRCARAAANERVSRQRAEQARAARAHAAPGGRSGGG